MPDVAERVELEHHLNEIVEAWLRRKHLVLGEQPKRPPHDDLDRAVWNALLCLQGSCFVA